MHYAIYMEYIVGFQDLKVLKGGGGTSCTRQRAKKMLCPPPPPLKNTFLKKIVIPLLTCNLFDCIHTSILQVRVNKLFI